MHAPILQLGEVFTSLDFLSSSWTTFNLILSNTKLIKKYFSKNIESLNYFSNFWKKNIKVGNLIWENKKEISTYST